MDRKIKIEHHGGLGVFWFIGWLFSIGFLELTFWRGLLALIVWPYFMGADIAERVAPPPTATEVAL
ncbi:MAG: hypothetical protein AAFY22_00115 [Pseudomonadota bacterium]